MVVLKNPDVLNRCIRVDKSPGGIRKVKDRNNSALFRCGCDVCPTLGTCHQMFSSVRVGPTCQGIGIGTMIWMEELDSPSPQLKTEIAVGRTEPLEWQPDLKLLQRVYGGRVLQTQMSLCESRAKEAPIAEKCQAARDLADRFGLQQEPAIPSVKYDNLSPVRNDAWKETGEKKEAGLIRWTWNDSMTERGGSEVAGVPESRAQSCIGFELVRSVEFRCASSGRQAENWGSQVHTSFA